MRVFNRMWLQEFCGWLRYDEKGKIIFCQVCRDACLTGALDHKYSLADVEEAILVEGKKTRASFMQFKYFLNSNREKSVIKLCETPVELEEYQEIFAPFVTLAQIFVTIPVTSVPCERGFSAQNRVHRASRNRLNPVSVESKMHTCIMHSSKWPSSTRKVSAKGQLCTLKKSEKGGNSLYADNL